MIQNERLTALSNKDDDHKDNYKKNICRTS